MKKISLFLLLLLFAFSTAQNVLKVEYEKVETKMPQIPDHLSEEAKKMILSQLQGVKKHFLYYSNGNTFYTDFAKVKQTEVSRDVKQVNEHERLVKSHKIGVTPLTIFHKKDEKGIYMYRKSFDEEYYEYMEPKWISIDYKNETQKIDSFECKLAKITNEKGLVSKVWYTEQIPISAGPYMFHSLPGLVLKIEAPTYTLYATKVSNNAKPSDMEKLNPKFKVYKGEELAKKKAQMSKPRVIKKTIRL